jgi:co-chaperonin GroES (HSP10)
MSLSPAFIAYGADGVEKATDGNPFVVKVLTQQSGSKAGVAIPGDFSGNPKKATVVFATPYLSTNYAITLAPITNGSKTFSPAVENKTASGFVINLHSNNVAGLIEIGWHTLLNGS